MAKSRKMPGAGECARMEAALRAAAVEDGPNPARINWRC